MPQQASLRLAKQKAQTGAQLLHSSENKLIIGSDQIASINGALLNKPGNYTNAFRQLKLCSGQTVCFYTSVCLFNTGNIQPTEHSDITHVHFRHLTEIEIENYLKIEQPYDCAGSFKAEGLGISLFEKIQTEDPTALIGLPLIGLGKLLRNEGINPLL